VAIDFKPETRMAERASMDSVPQVLVTGATGFIATHIIHQLLTEGRVKVRGTVRSVANEAKVKPLYELVPNATYPLELVEADLSSDEKWGEAIRNCSHVYHVASPLPPGIPQDENQLITPAVNGTLSVLKACAEAGTVKRVVLTSSVAAVCAGLYAKDTREYTEDDWSDEVICPPYEKSKLKAELAAWEFLETLEDNVKFELIAINPAVVVGPPLTTATGEATSLTSVKKLIGNEIPALIPLNLPLVDVRDVAAAHIAAMNIQGINGERFIITAENRWIKEIADVITHEFASQGYKVPSLVAPKAGVWIMKFFDVTIKMIYPCLDNVIRLRNDKMKSLLGIQPRDINQSIVDTCYGLIKMGNVPKGRFYHGPIEQEMNNEETNVEDQQDTIIEQNVPNDEGHVI
jgi:nucleoside-diphosphate-sugar epimerase